MVEEKNVETSENSQPLDENKVETPNVEGKENRRPARGDRRPRRERREKNVKDDKEKEFEERVVFINRVCKTVKGGRRMKFSALVVVGDRKGRYGFALGKAAEVPDAIKKASEAARKNLHVIKLVKGGTIPHDVNGIFGATRVYLKPAPEGTGVIAGGPVRAILELAGVTNVCSKVYGSRTAINVIRATNKGISELKSFKEVKSLRSKE